MPSIDRYTLNELQQAVLDVLAEAVVDDARDDPEAAALTRETIIERVQQVPGQDDVNGNHMGPCLAALKRRELVRELAKGTWAITRRGITYVDLDGEPEPEAPRGAETQSAPAPRQPWADRKTCCHCGISFIRPDAAPIPKDRCERCHEEIEALAAVGYQGPSMAGASSTACDDQHAPEAPSWDGEGRPPVGCECEWVDAGRDPRRVVVMGYYGEYAWLRVVHGQTPLTVHYLPDSFRPLRTPAQRAEDEAVEAMLSLDPYVPDTRLGMMSREDFCRALYRAGCRFPEPAKSAREVPA